MEWKWVLETTPPTLKTAKVGLKKNGAVLPVHRDRFLSFLVLTKRKEVCDMPQPAKSAKLQLLNGNPNKKNTEELRKRAAAEEKLKMATDKIKPPTWLDPLGKQTFEFIAEELLTVELVSNPDLYSMALYSDWYSQYVALEKQLRKLQREYKLNYAIAKEKAEEEGKPFNDPNELIGNPLSRQMDTASRNLRSFGSDLGLSPSARAKLAIKMADDGGDDDDDF